MEPADSRWWRPQTTCFFLLWAGLLWFAPANMLGDPGTLWHPVAGERMLQAGQLAHTDPFSFTCQGQPWIAQQWLGEITMALLYRLAGLDAIVLAAVTLLAATYAFLAGRFFRTGLPWLACAVLIMLVIAASSYHFLPRPHIVTIALMAWMFAQLSDIEAGRRSPRRLLILPVLYVLWVNIHGGALGGIATSTCVLLAWLVWHHLPRASGTTSLRLWPRGGCAADRSQSRCGERKPVAPPVIIGMAASLSFVAVLVNPYGPALPRVWVSLMNSKVLPELIVEHAPMQILSIEGATIMTLAGVYLALLVTAWRHSPRVTWLIPLLWLGLTFTRIRHGPLFAVTAAIAIADMLPYSPLAARFVRRTGRQRGAHPDTLAMPISGRWIQGRDARAVETPGCTLNNAPASPRFSVRPALIPVSVVMLALALQANAVTCPLIGVGWSRLDPDCWPVEATKVLRQHIGHGAPGAKVFNDLGMGGYLIHAAPETHIYIDDRCELYRDDGLLQYKQFTTNPELIDAFAAYEDIGLALTKSGSRFDRHFAASPAWMTLHRDATASLYRRVKQGQ